VLHHVSIEVPPEEGDRSVEFWGLLGFEEVEAPAVLGDGFRWVEREGTQIHLILTEGHTAPVLGHAAVVTPDIDAALAALTEAGFEAEESRKLWGARRAFAIGPGGHRVELMASPPPAGGAGS
jgi:catechol 2,3-dioxygenase-like lactoylglutathione lyase family enzyme